MARPRKLTPEQATANQRAAENHWHKENTEILKFCVRLRKGCRGAYKELAARRGVSLASLVKNYLDGECRKEGIDV